jgi:hypothetical protein
LVPSTEAPAAGRALPIRAIDFRIWDELIEQLELDIYSSGLLIWLYRETHSRGMHNGDALSIQSISHALRISTGTVKRRLNVLDHHKLIVRTRRHERGKRNYAPTHIEVQLPPAPEKAIDETDLAR